ncbi:MAG: V-type ATP synthase subunit E family protein [Gammaproteobacteria bacterium]|nr:V-type ATP synthase subunit E family protein [Gammaproteobacteria bacterium]
MTNEINIDDLEKALLERATALSKEYSERAKRSYDHYIEDENKRLRLREEREVMAAKMQADQVYRRMVQTEELQSIKRVDQLRWQLMHKVIDDVQLHLKSMTEDRKRYLELIKQLLLQSFNLISEKKVVVEFNSNDYQWLKNQWQEIIKSLNTNKSIELSLEHFDGMGGFIIYDHEYKIRVNYTFEGLIERQSDDINQIIAENLFAELTPVRSNINGR